MSKFTKTLLFSIYTVIAVIPEMYFIAGNTTEKAWANPLSFISGALFGGWVWVLATLLINKNNNE